MAALSDHTFVITGASTGIGFATAKSLVERGAGVVMVSRHPGRATRGFDRIRSLGVGQVELEIADLASLAEVRDLAQRILAKHDRLDGLINNAGILVARRRLTTDGFERTMAVNHLAPFLLSDLLLPLLAESGGRIVNVSSDGHRSGDLRRAPLEDIMRGSAWGGMLKAYGDSKLANIQFTREWMKRRGDSGVVANALHPGVLRTRVWNQNLHPISLFMQPFKFLLGAPSRGADAVLNLLRNDVAGDGGHYYDELKPARASKQAHDDTLASELWGLSEQFLGVHL